MAAFTRIYKYVWPQWYRIAVVFFAVIMIGFLFTASYLTIIPLLKVMMSEEGMHGWVDRKVCSWRYDMDLYVPGITDFTDSNDTNISYYLKITDVKDDGIAQTAGLKREDRIVGAGNFLINENLEKIPRAQLLQQISIAPQQTTITIQVERKPVIST